MIETADISTGETKSSRQLLVLVPEAGARELFPLGAKETSSLLQRRGVAPHCGRAHSAYQDPNAAGGSPYVAVGTLFRLTPDAFSAPLPLHARAVPAPPGTTPLASVRQPVPLKRCHFSAKGLPTPVQEGRGLSPK